MRSLHAAAAIYKKVKAVAYQGGDYNNLVRLAKQGTDRVRERISKAFYKLAQKGWQLNLKVSHFL